MSLVPGSRSHCVIPYGMWVLVPVRLVANYYTLFTLLTLRKRSDHTNWTHLIPSHPISSHLTLSELNWTGQLTLFRVHCSGSVQDEWCDRFLTMVQQSSQMLSTADRRWSLVNHTARLALCTAWWAWSRLLRGYVCGRQDLPLYSQRLNIVTPQLSLSKLITSN